MKKHVSFILFFFLINIGFSSRAQNSGENLYKTCAACHTIGKGRLVGPDLTKIYEKREQDWLIRFIRSSQKVIKDGDPHAVELFKEYNQIPMPDNNLSDNEIISIIGYIRDTDEGKLVKTGEAVNIQQTDTLLTASVAFSNEMLMRGKALFYGLEKFKNGASSCIPCHNIRDESIIGGGNLSLDLTNSYTRLGPAGIKAILSNPPFPAMNVALGDKDLTQDEIEAVSALLQFSDQRYGNNPPQTNGGLIFAVLSLVFVISFLVSIYILYDNRKIPTRF